MLFGQPSFSVVFKEMMLWIKECVEEARRSDEAYHPGNMSQILMYTKCYSCLLIH